MEDHLFLVRKYGKRSWAILGEMIKDIDIRSQMSVHQNVLKLLGTQNPIQVYEFVRDIILSNCICIPSTKGLNSEPLPLKCKLRIAMGIANAVAYLYTAFSGLLSIHIYIQPGNIILDENNVAKLIDFSLSMSIPEGQWHVQVFHIRGKLGYTTP